MRIDASTRFVNLSDEPFDIAIRHARNGTGNPHDLLLFPDEVVAVCAPSVATLFADGEKDIGKVKLLRCDTPLGLPGSHIVDLASEPIHVVDTPGFAR